MAANESYGAKVAMVQGATTLQIKAGGAIAMDVGSTITNADRPFPQWVRRRCTIAEVNAGVTILAAVAGYSYRMVDAYAVAVGGNVAAVTSVDLMGTLSSARILVSFLVAGLTRSTMLRAGAATNGVLLADGASFTANDPNTAITLIKAGADITTATHVDIAVQIELVAA